MSYRSTCNTSGYSDFEGRPPYAMNRTDRLKLVMKMAFPASYVINTEKEDICIHFAQNFRKQFVHLYPNRAPLLLTVDNENMKVQKFISSFIRPSLLPYENLYDDATCAKFIADYIRYDPLEDFHTLPTRVVSPATTLAWQCGSSIEMSILLTSLLIGAGYNAYTVIGYAHPKIVANDQTDTQWPSSLPVEVNSDDEQEEALEKQTQYTQYLKRRPNLESVFDKAAAERAKQQPLKKFTAVSAPAAPVDRNMFHCWVHIRAGKRGVDKDRCFEPSTGMVFDPTVSDHLYFGVEAIFNHRNYFVNMCPALPLSELVFDMYDLSVWEHIFLSDPELTAMAAQQTESEGADGGAGTDGLNMTALREGAMDFGAAGDFQVDLPASWVEHLTLSREQYENQFPGRSKRIHYANNTVVEHHAPFSHHDLRVLEVRIPEDLLNPFTSGIEVHTFYQHRHDFLRRMSVYPHRERNMAPRKRHEWFLPGRKKEAQIEGLRELIDEPGIQRTMRFYWKARADGLALRREDFVSIKDPAPRKICEHYKGREHEDHLVYRSATYETYFDHDSRSAI